MPHIEGGQPGFGDPVLDSQQVFMSSLRALAYPGTILELPVAPAGPKPFHAGTTALLLTLLDRDTPLWLDPLGQSGEAAEWLSFFCGCPLTRDPARAHFAVITAGERLPALERFNHGGEENPEESATIIIQVERLAQEQGQSLSGPGIEDRAELSVRGLDESFWKYLGLNSRLFPLGLDFLLVGPDNLCGLPRTVSVEA